MGERRALRRIADPVVAAGPAGVRIRTRLHLSGPEATAVAAIGSFLGSVYRAESAGRVEAGLLDRRSLAGCMAVVIENLDFAEARATGRDTMGRGKRGKRFRRTVAGMPTARFGNRLTAMAAHRGIAIIGVDAAYTSKWGSQHWTKPLQQQTSEPVTGHHGAATAIGRRGLGLAIRRRPAGPRNGQGTHAGTPPARPERQPNHDGRHGSSGPPPPTRCVAVPRRTPAASGQHRSGRNRAALTAAAHS